MLERERERERERVKECVIKIAGEGECLREKERGTRERMSERMSERDDHIKERQKMKAFLAFSTAADNSKRVLIPWLVNLLIFRQK